MQLLLAHQSRELHQSIIAGTTNQLEVGKPGCAPVREQCAGKTNKTGKHRLLEHTAGVQPNRHVPATHRGGLEEDGAPDRAGEAARSSAPAGGAQGHHVPEEVQHKALRPGLHERAGHQDGGAGRERGGRFDEELQRAVGPGACAEHGNRGGQEGCRTYVCCFGNLSW